MLTEGLILENFFYHCFNCILYGQSDVITYKTLVYQRGSSTFVGSQVQIQACLVRLHQRPFLRKSQH